MKRLLISTLLFFAFSLPSQAIIDPKVIKTPGGLTAWYVYDKNTPVIALNFLFKGGARLDPAGKAGVADLTADLLDSGTMDKDPNDFDAYKQDYAIQLDFKADADQLGGSLATLVQYKDQAFGLLREVLTSPRLKEDTFKNVTNMAKTALANATNEPSYLAKRRLEKILFDGHPYGTPAEGTPESIGKISIKDVGDYIKNNLSKDRLLMAITGNVTEAEAATILDSTFGVLPSTSTAPKENRIQPAIQGQHEVIDLKIPQSIIFFVLPGIMYDDPDFLKMALLMHIMGEDITSRLFKEIREKRGLAYAVQAGTSWKQEAGYLTGMVGSPKEKASQSIDILKQEWIKLKKDGITAEELDAAKNFMLNSYPLNFKNSGAISKILLGYQFVKRPIDYFKNRDKLISSISLKDMNDFITKVIEPEKLTFIVVGRPDEAKVRKEEKG